ncbi:MAG: biopolymer transporter ExbD, partial [Myxococcota bacterium]|nr:biopolymer transporter ExbD [Myxococcota bacterium]
MGMGTGGSKKGRMSEINVTPLVDVMLVLLIIFMVAAGVQRGEVEAERERTLEEADRILEEAYRVKELPKHQKVGVELPKVNSETVNLHETKKLQLTVDHKLVFSLPCTDESCKKSRTILVDCLSLSPDMGKHLKAPKTKRAFEIEQEAFAPCLKALGEKLVDNAKLQADKELYVLADRRLDYGKVLRVMAVVRQAGVTKFGL